MRRTPTSRPRVDSVILVVDNEVRQNFLKTGKKKVDQGYRAAGVSSLFASASSSAFAASASAAWRFPSNLAASTS